MGYRKTRRIEDVESELLVFFSFVKFSRRQFLRACSTAGAAPAAGSAATSPAAAASCAASRFEGDARPTRGRDDRRVANGIAGVQADSHVGVQEHGFVALPGAAIAVVTTIGSALL